MNVGDPGVHNGESTFLGVLYSRQADQACIAPVKVRAPTKKIDPNEVNMGGGMGELVGGGMRG